MKWLIIYWLVEGSVLFLYHKSWKAQRVLYPLGFVKQGRESMDEEVLGWVLFRGQHPTCQAGIPEREVDNSPHSIVPLSLETRKIESKNNLHIGS